MQRSVLNSLLFTTTTTWVNGLLPTQPWRSTSMHVVLLSDAHRLTEEGMTQFIRWCTKAEVNKIIMFGVPGAVPPASEGAGQPFQDLLATFGVGIRVKETRGTDVHRLRDRPAPWASSMDAIFEERVLKSARSRDPVPSWIIVCGSEREQRTVQWTLKELIRKNRSRFETCMDRFPGDGGKQLGDEHVLLHDEVPMRHYNLVALAPGSSSRELNVALECTTRSESYLVDLRRVRSEGKRITHLLQRQTYLRQILKRTDLRGVNV